MYQQIRQSDTVELAVRQNDGTSRIEETNRAIGWSTDRKKDFALLLLTVGLMMVAIFVLVATFQKCEHLKQREYQCLGWIIEPGDFYEVSMVNCAFAYEDCRKHICFTCFIKGPGVETCLDAKYSCIMTKKQLFHLLLITSSLCLNIATFIYSLRDYRRMYH